MFTLGGILFILSGLVVFVPDRLYKKGKIKTIKSLLTIKVLGLVLAIIGAIFMIYGK